jgi:hypothetical protein
MKIFDEKDPCLNCHDRTEDKYGLVCDIACGKNSAFRNLMYGAHAQLAQDKADCEARIREILGVCQKAVGMLNANLEYNRGKVTELLCTVLAKYLSKGESDGK